MKFREFEERARRLFREIPREYREGVDGLTVVKDPLPHPVLPDVYTLGECLTESYPSDWGGPQTTRSRVVLYYGSFRRLAALDPGFSWEGELWETLVHELRHHLESLADERALEEADYAADEAFKRERGLPFDPWFYRHGEEAAPGIWRVEHDFFLEREWDPDAFAAAREVRFPWHGRVYAVPRPGRLGDVHFVLVWGVEAGPGALELVLVRRRRWWEVLRSLLRKEAPEVLESEAEAREVG